MKMKKESWIVALVSFIILILIIGCIKGYNIFAMMIGFFVSNM